MIFKEVPKADILENLVKEMKAQLYQWPKKYITTKILKHNSLRLILKLLISSRNILSL